MNIKTTKKTTIQFILFGIIGVSNTLVSLVVYYAFVLIGVNYIIANTFAFVAGVLNAFYWNRKYVFGDQSGNARQIVQLSKVFLSYGFTFILNTLFLYVMVSQIGISTYVAPLINALIITPLNFLLNKYWAFK